MSEPLAPPPADPVRTYREQWKDVYERYARFLSEVLEDAAEAITPYPVLVQWRVKSVSSFAEKIQRKGYDDPLNQTTDLAGVRVITHTKAEARQFCKLIEERFLVDRAHSHDPAARLGAREFGYRSVHFVVQLKRGSFAGADPDLFGKYAEVQVRTIPEHCWAEVGHDRFYKPPFRREKMPKRLQREFAVISAMLENVDTAFTRLSEALAAYHSEYGGSTDVREIEEELRIQRLVLAQEKAGKKKSDTEKIEHGIARLLLSLGPPRWQEVVELLKPYPARSRPPRLLLCAGIACCLQHRHGGGEALRREGLRYLEQVYQADSQNVETVVELAGALLGGNKADAQRAHELYSKAYGLDDSDARVLVGYVQSRIRMNADPSFLEAAPPSISRAVRRCQDQIEVGVNLPWAYYRLGELFLLWKKPYDSLGAYAKAIQATPETSRFFVDEALTSLERLERLAPALDGGHRWARWLLLLGRAARFDKGKLPRELRRQASPKVPELRAYIDPKGAKGGKRVVILAGGCDKEAQSKVESYRSLLQRAFGDFDGVVISGGTTAGVCGLVGDVKRDSRAGFLAIAYLPPSLPRGARKHTAYEVCDAGTGGFSPEQPLQNWTDLMAAGVDPRHVRLVGINGGSIAALEYRLALALGASTGLLEESGREADLLLGDPEWKSKSLLHLPADPMTIWNFIRWPFPAWGRPKQRERMASRVHEHYQKQERERLKERAGPDEPPRWAPALVDWEWLPESYKESNRRQVDHIKVKLDRIGIALGPQPGRDVLTSFNAQEVLLLAELEHGRWCVEKLLDGWVPGLRRDEADKVHDQLRPWDKLTATEKQRDVDAVKEIPGLLAGAGLWLRRIRRAASSPSEPV